MAKIRRAQNKRLMLLIGAAVAVVIVAGLLLAQQFNKTSSSATFKPSISPSPTNHGTGNSNPSTPTPSAAKGATGNSGGSAAPPTPVTQASPPPAPTGDLLNQHTVSASGSTKLESTCQTFAGYNCRVQATNNSTGKVVLVGSVTADGNGTAIIDWSGKDVGAGTWTVRLLASNGSHSTQSTLFDTLEVTP